MTHAAGSAAPQRRLGFRQRGNLTTLIHTETDRLTSAVNTLSEEAFRWNVPSGPA
jgi:hypothetical protein